MSCLVSVVIPAYNAARTLGECLAAVRAQQRMSGPFEIIVVDDGSTDATAHIARRCGVQVVVQPNQGAAAARNRGIDEARGHWVAFTDSDCIPSRHWLANLVRAAERAGADALGAAGRTVGYESQSSAARFVDLTGGLDAERHLAHPVFPFPPSCNLLYRRAALQAVGGFDGRFVAYEGCDLHQRLLQTWGDSFAFEPRAVVLHRHRADWRGYWRQQRAYGRGYGQFFIRYRDQLDWSVYRELIAWLRTAVLAAGMLRWRGDAGLVRRGTFMKHCAQRVGFIRTYWSSAERLRWHTPPVHETGTGFKAGAVPVLCAPGSASVPEEHGQSPWQATSQLPAAA